MVQASAVVSPTERKRIAKRIVGIDSRLSLYEAPQSQQDTAAGPLPI